MWLRKKNQYFFEEQLEFAQLLSTAVLEEGSLCMNHDRPAQDAYCFLFSYETRWTEPHEHLSAFLCKDKGKVILGLIS